MNATSRVSNTKAALLVKGDAPASVNVAKASWNERRSGLTGGWQRRSAASVETQDANSLAAIDV
jgi:hypothetical protein